MSDFSQNWVIEGNDHDSQSAEWNTVYETWFMSEKDAEWAEKKQIKDGQPLRMQPRSFEECLKTLLALRSRDKWDYYRFRNTDSGDLILACILR